MCFGEDMMEVYDFSVQRGATFRKDVRLKKGGEVMDLTGWSGKCQVRPEPESEVLTCEMGLVIVPEEGLVELRIEAEVTAAIDMGVYAWDLRLTDAEGVARYYLGGKFKVIGSVTK